MTAPFDPTSVTAFLRQLPAGLQAWWRTQRHWLFTLIPFVVILWEPLRWCVALWFIRDSQQTYQIFIPLGALLLAVPRLPDFQRIQDELAQHFPDPRSPQRRGNLIPLALAGFLFLIAYLATMPPLAILAAILAIAGMIFHVYGPFSMRPLLVPLGFLLLMVPLPVSAMMALVGNFSRLAALFASQTLTALRTPTDIQYDYIVIKANNLEIPATPAYSGVLLTASIFCGTLFWVLWKRPTLGRAGALLTASVLIPSAVNLSRLVLLGRIGASRPDLAMQLHKLPLLPSILVSVTLLVLLSHLLGRRRTPKIIWADPDPT